MSTVIKSVSNKPIRKQDSDRDLKIYNIFTRYFTGPAQWMDVTKKAKEMGFNTIYLNPFQRTGSSKSMYSIVDYFKFDEFSMKGIGEKEGKIQLKKFLEDCKAMEMRVLFDLVVNHVGIDSKIVKKYNHWFEKEENGEIRKAWCTTETGKNIWEDCAKLDLSIVKSGAWNFIEEVCRCYLALGFDGFRCDVAAYIPEVFWTHLISLIRKDYPNAIFVGESFMVPMKSIDKLQKSGFDYVFNSAKWWNGLDEWYYEQNSHFIDNGIKTISFPDNHDTERLMKEVSGNIELYKQRLYLLAVLSSAFEITYGFEYGFQKKCHVVETRPKDIEKTELDFTADIKKALKFRKQYEILRTEGRLTNIYPNSYELLFLQKESTNSSYPQKALFLLNLTNEEKIIERKKVTSVFQGECVNIKEEEGEMLYLKPYEIRIYIAEAKLQPKIKMNFSHCLIDKGVFVQKYLKIKPLYPDEVFVEILACGICGSDRKEFNNGRFFWKSEASGGHEFVGRVIQVGHACTTVKVGDVVCNCIPREREAITQFGGFSKYLVARETCLYRLPKHIDVINATIIEPLACAIHAGKMIKDEKNIAIVGSGPIAILVERYLNATTTEKNLNLIYKHDSIVKFASKSTKCITFQDVEKHGLFEAQRKFHTIIECSGNAEILKKLCNWLLDGGKIILTGIYNDSMITQENIFSLTTMMFREYHLKGSFLYTREDFQEAANLIIGNQILVRDLIQIMPFCKCQAAFEIPSKERVKIVLSRYFLED